MFRLNSNEKKDYKVIFISSIGGALEFYDFMIFLFLANILGNLFFPSTTSINSLLAVFSTFAVGYFVRPIGGVIFSHFGDRYGRKNTFYLSIVLMAIPSFLISILPTFNTIGIFAPILLVFMRVLQGLAIGGEIPGAITFTYEHMSKKNKGKSIAFIFLALTVAVLLAQCVIIGLNILLSNHQFTSWGWRIAFLIGAALGAVGIYLRKRLNETPMFKKIKSNKSNVKIPVITLLRMHPIEFIQGICITSLASVCFFLLFIYMPIFIINFKIIYPHVRSYAHMLNTINLIVFCFALIFFGILSDFVKNKINMVLIGSMLLILFIYPAFILITHFSLIYVAIALIVLGLLFSIITASYGSVLAGLFPTEIRYTGISMTYNIAFAILGGLTPLVLTLLIKYTNDLAAPADFMMFVIFVCLLGIYFTEKTLRKRHKNYNQPLLN